MFEFVNHDSTQGFNDATRTRIRSQAAMMAISQKRRSHVVEQIREQLVADIVDSSKIVDPTLNLTWDSPTTQADHLTIPASMPPSGISLVRSEYNLDPTNFSALTSIHIGAACKGIFAEEPTHLKGLLTCHEKSYFSHLPQRFGQSACLDNALFCLVIKIASLMAPCSALSNTLILAKYGKALATLQAALEGSASWTLADTLCAVEVLALFEILNSPTEGSWSQHIAGAAKMIRLRGPQDFKSEYDRDLLIAMIGPIVCESFANNESCFFEGQDWLQLIQYCATGNNSFSDRSDLAISISQILVRMPGLAKRTTYAIFNQDSLTVYDRQQIERDLNQARQEIHQWRTNFNRFIVLSVERIAHQLDLGKRFELLGTSLVLATFINRFIGAICPNQRCWAEEEAQACATEIQTLADDVPKINPRAGFYLAQKAKMAKATINTASIWKDSIESGKLIEPWKFKEWCGMMNRKTPSIPETSV
ncbi:hypothetical protein BGW36DRAFT_403159 [Talaromyces proteolyticus]|uniref:Uncharacterized protein n=1 Tax=Talaromyces proteolyticus TaxID=1131652 RepID=A0AAD4L132_9EURO|nr:uncharacterized protein BGW36DRAFT_403159 [Talaromyces proteolyticus]KAH8705618.1 hypothetical protein BGW36DRAFT_403159 [Talaromyces proteolyticus]